MTLLDRGADAVTWVQPALTIDGLGDVEYDYGDAATRTLIGGWIQQVATSERADTGPVVVRSTTLFTRQHGIGPHDRFEQGTDCWEVDGQPREVGTPETFHHAEIVLVRVRG